MIWLNILRCNWNSKGSKRNNGTKEIFVENGPKLYITDDKHTAIDSRRYTHSK